MVVQLDVRNVRILGCNKVPEGSEVSLAIRCGEIQTFVEGFFDCFANVALDQRQVECDPVGEEIRRPSEIVADAE